MGERSPSITCRRQTQLEFPRSLLFSRSVVSNSLRSHGLQHARVTCSSPSPGVCSNSHVHRISNAIQPSHPLSSLSPPAFNLFQHQGLFQGVSSSHQVPRYWSFSFSISPSNEYSGLISFRIDWFYLAVHGTLKSLLQHHSSKASVLQRQPSLWSNSHVHT